MKGLNRTILAVDDDPGSIRLLGTILTRHGYQVLVAESGERALDLADAVAPATRIDLILLDMRMPGGMDGIEACRRLKRREELRNTPVIFLTGKDDAETMVRAFQAGGADCLLKPFNADILLARVRTHARLGLLSNNLESALADRSRELVEANAKLRRLTMQIALAGERERRRLAEELHDSPMQKLALAQVQIAAAARRRDDQAEARLEAGIELMREALQELRSLQFELSPPALYREGLAAGLRWLASDASRRFGVDLSFAQRGSLPDLPPDTMVVLFQCARELVYNLVKHAKASRGRIELDAGDSEVVLTVSDDGEGFPSAGEQPASSNEGGYGLFSLRERLKLLGGALSVDSDGMGSRVAARVPVGKHLRLVSPPERSESPQ
jgi:signal transduction histidine kinase